MQNRNIGTYVCTEHHFMTVPSMDDHLFLKRAICNTTEGKSVHKVSEMCSCIAETVVTKQGYVRIFRHANAFQKLNGSSMVSGVLKWRKLRLSVVFGWQQTSDMFLFLILILAEQNCFITFPQGNFLTIRLLTQLPHTGVAIRVLHNVFGTTTFGL